MRGTRQHRTESNRSLAASECMSSISSSRLGSLFSLVFSLFSTTVGRLVIVVLVESSLFASARKAVFLEIVPPLPDVTQRNCHDTVLCVT